MVTTEPFVLFDCGLVRCASGRVCSNLRELQDALRTVPDAELAGYREAVRRGGVKAQLAGRAILPAHHRGAP